VERAKNRGSEATEVDGREAVAERLWTGTKLQKFW
jgi:hypothetical protein